MTDETPSQNPTPPENPSSPSDSADTSSDDQTMRAAPISADSDLEHRIQLSRDYSDVVRIYITDNEGNPVDDE